MLAAVVLGGASLTGGVGRVFGTILGVTLLAILQNGPRSGRRLLLLAANCSPA